MEKWKSISGLHVQKSHFCSFKKKYIFFTSSCGVLKEKLFDHFVSVYLLHFWEIQHIANCEIHLHRFLYICAYIEQFLFADSKKQTEKCFKKSIVWCAHISDWLRCKIVHAAFSLLDSLLYNIHYTVYHCIMDLRWFFKNILFFVFQVACFNKIKNN